MAWLAAAVLALLCAALAARLRALARDLRSARVALAEAEARGRAPRDRVVEGRADHFGLLWFPQLTVSDEAKTVVSAAGGLPHCPRCVKAMALTSGPNEEWACPTCEERRAGTAADMRVMDDMIAQTLREFLARHPGYRRGPGLPEPKSPLG